ncbi:succinylglutamate desuccinylase [Roseateles noduli]|uniref:succinylglutamate desuccinylase n=1 Tax=Roseateles noduli TaxID=2052484 RepID=UPI003D6474A5
MAVAMNTQRPGSPASPSSPVFALAAPDLSRARAGNTGVEGVWTFDAGRPGRHVLITAIVHGNELCGAWALHDLLEAGLRPDRGRLTLAFCNLAAFDRFDPLDHDASRFVDEDLNRQWTSDRITLGDSLERRRAARLAPFVRDADWLLDLHSMHERSSPLTLTGLHDGNVDLAVAMGAGTTVVMDAGHADGMRMRDFEAFGTAESIAAGKRSLLIECGFHGDLASRQVARDHCVRFLALSGLFAPDALRQALDDWWLPDAAEIQVLEVTGAVVARSTDIDFVAGFQGLETFPLAGTLVGHDAGRPLVTPHDDCVLVMPSLRHARPGVTVVRFARRRAIRRADRTGIRA